MRFDEDRARSRKDNGPENLSILRKLTLNILRKARPKLPVSRNRKRAGWSGDFARPIISQMRWPSMPGSGHLHGHATACLLCAPGPGQGGEGRGMPA